MDALKQSALEMHERGSSYSEIAEEMAISKSTAYAWVKEAKLLDTSHSETREYSDERAFEPFETARTPHTERFPNERSGQPIKGNVRVKEPSYVTELQERVAFLEKSLHSFTSHIKKIDLLLITSLKSSCTNVYETMKENEGEVWTIDELYDLSGKLESTRQSILSIDQNADEWISIQIDPLLRILHEATQSLIDEDMDEGELYFFNN